MKLAKDVKKIKKDLKQLKKNSKDCHSPQKEEIIKMFETPINRLEQMVREQHYKESEEVFESMRKEQTEKILEKIDDIILSQEDALNTSHIMKPKK
jgi:uncharacterized alpha-E superfamily protein